MPFKFRLPSTSQAVLSDCVSCPSHPSLPQQASIQRAVFRNVLKQYRRTEPGQRDALLSSVLAAVDDYLPYIATLADAQRSKSTTSDHVEVESRGLIALPWRSALASTLSDHRPMKVKVLTLEDELCFVLSTLAILNVLFAQSQLRTLFAPITPSTESRTQAILSATKSLLMTASIHSYLSSRCTESDASRPIIETLSQTQSALSALALAEATLLSVLKDDPYPPVIAQARNEADKDWMIKPPEIPKVRAHLFARLCLAAAENAQRAEAGLSASGKVDREIMDYTSALKRTCRAKACRFLGIDADLGGETGKAIAWLQAAKHEVDTPDKEFGMSSLVNIGKFKRERSEKKEDKLLEKGGNWGKDAGRLEESRIIDHLYVKWNKMNDTINTQPVPDFNTLLPYLPSGRDVHSIQPYILPKLNNAILMGTRVPARIVTSQHVNGGNSSSDEEYVQEDNALPGAFPEAAVTNPSAPYF